MLVENLRQEALESRFELVDRELVLSTFRNATGISRLEQLVVVQPSGNPHENLKSQQMVVTDLDGRIIEGAHMAWMTTTPNQHSKPVGRALHDTHCLRKHPKDARCGQTLGAN